MKRVLFVYGTRPEAIKMAPLVTLCRDSTVVEPLVCLTGQHRAMLDQINSFFDIRGDFDLDVMKPNQSLAQLSSKIIEGLDHVIETARPHLVLVQGDTTTAFIGALAAYYRKVPVAHLEAGLRSGNKYSPYPEEVNRSLIGRIADFHFAPTETARKNLSREGVLEGVHVVGNTVIDALLMGLAIIKRNGESKYDKHFADLDFSRPVILVTGHRRESFGEPFERICSAIAQIATRQPDCTLVYPVHLNPNVQEPVRRLLGSFSNVRLIDPLDYPDLIWLMSKSTLVLTDSGGIQEEAPTLGKPVLVMRDVTERMEGVAAGTARLVGTDDAKIVRETLRLLDNPVEYEKMAKANNPYGDGKASERIISILSNRL